MGRQARPTPGFCSFPTNSSRGIKAEREVVVSCRAVVVTRLFVDPVVISVKMPFPDNKEDLNVFVDDLSEQMVSFQ